MHQVAQRITKGLTRRTMPMQDISVALLLSNIFDCDVFTKLFADKQQIEVLAATTDLESYLKHSQRICPQILILDPNLSNDAVEQTILLVRQGFVRHLLVFDDRVREERLDSLLRLNRVSYLTRQVDFDKLLESILRIARRGERVFDPKIQPRLHGPASKLSLAPLEDQPSILSLTRRERQILKLLAEGHSVRGCAEQLKLAESTVDNHKSRMMKKLNIHKNAELVHVAIREGLIVV